MFNGLEHLPPDPILGLSLAFRDDSNPDKVDLGVGVYKDEAGNTTIVNAIKEAERRFLEQENSKAYIAQVGVPEYNTGILELILGHKHPAMTADRVRTVLAPGGSGALRITAGLIKRSAPGTRIWVSDPTWANHIPLLGSAGVDLQPYAYYDKTSGTLVFDRMLAALAQATAGDVVLLHGCCHNPCGADLNRDQWNQLAEFMAGKKLVPFIDLAYQGFGDGMEQDAYGVRLMAEKLPEVLVASSCSKNFGLYRERTGSVLVIAESPADAAKAQSHLTNIARTMYSMPPAHGAFLAGIVLQDSLLKKSWLDEVAAMCARMKELRNLLVTKLADNDAPRDFSFIAGQKGMFSFLGITPTQVTRLRDEYSIYIVGSSRINVAGISHANIDYLANAIVKVLKT